jgi:hypothetical protein
MDFNIKNRRRLTDVIFTPNFRRHRHRYAIFAYFLTREVNDSVAPALPEPFSWKVLCKIYLSRSIAHEEEIMLDHDYDGIKRIQSPPAVPGLFYGGIVILVTCSFTMSGIGHRFKKRRICIGEVDWSKREVEAYKATLANEYRLTLNSYYGRIAACSSEGQHEKRNKDTDNFLVTGRWS